MPRPFCLLLIGLLTAQPAFGTSAYYDPVFGTLKTSSIVYGAGAINNGGSTTNLLLDLYQPTNIGTPLPGLSPGIVLIHGGSFVSGGRNDLASLAATYSTYGYTVVSIDYRLLGQNPPPEPGPAANLIPPPPPFTSLPNPQGIYAIDAAYQDSMKAMAWMQANAATYHIDTNRIAIGGVSAGAITSLLEAYNSPPANVAPKVVLDFLGSMYGTEGTIQAGDAPAFVVHGTADTTVPFSGDQAIVDRLTSLGIYNEFYVESGLGHTVDFNLMYGGQTLLQKNMIFLVTHLAPEPASFSLAALAGIALLLAAGRRKSAR